MLLSTVLRSAERYSPFTVASLVVLIFASCAAPLLEQAVDPSGLSGGVGIEAMGMDWPSGDNPLGGVIAEPVGQISYRPWDRWSLGVRAAGGLSFDLIPNDFLLPRYGPAYDLRLSAKYRILDRASVKMSAGFLRYQPWQKAGFLQYGPLVTNPAWLAEVDGLYDINDMVTFTLGAGFYDFIGGVRAGLIFHPRITKRLRAHISLVSADVITGGLGFGLDWSGKDSTLKAGKDSAPNPY
jgi:hypothetical protein